MSDPIVIKPGESTTVTFPVNLTVGADVTFNSTVSQVVQAAPTPVVPWVVPADDPNATNDVKEIQKNIGVPIDGWLGRVTLDAIKAAVKPAVVVPPTPPAPKSILHLGSSTPPSGIAADKIEANTKSLEASMGGAVLESHRTYFQWNEAIGGLAGLDAVLANDEAAGRLSYWSIKPPNGSWQGWGAVANQNVDVKAFEDKLAAVLKKYKGSIASFHHEPENDRDLSTLTDAQKNAHRAQFAAAHDAFVDAMRSRGVPESHLFGPTFMHWTLTPGGTAKTGNVDAWMPTASKHDFVGFDDYNEGYDGDLAFATKYGLLLAIGEYGKGGVDGPTQAAFVQRAVDWFKANRTQVVSACYWNQVTLLAPSLVIYGNEIKANTANYPTDF